MNSDAERRTWNTSTAILRRDLDELREAFNFRKSKFKEQLAQFQSAHHDLWDTYKALECNFKEHLAQTQLAQSQSETRLAMLAVKLKNYKIQALQGIRLLAKTIPNNNKKAKSTSSSEESVDSDEDGAANISLVAAPRSDCKTDGMPEAVQTPVAARVNKEAPVYTCAVCLKENNTKRNFEAHQRTAHVQQNEDKTMGVNTASVCSNSPAAKKRKTAAQETDTNDTEKPTTTETTSEDRTDQSQNIKTSSTSHSPSRAVEVQEVVQADQISEHALVHPTRDSFHEFGP